MHCHLHGSWGRCLLSLHPLQDFTILPGVSLSTAPHGLAKESPGLHSLEQEEKKGGREEGPEGGKAEKEVRGGLHKEKKEEGSEKIRASMLNWGNV